ncbi:MAG: hypothetical protein KF789_08805 [Bdellovibrionaceae bacterium]|nr:hypothetical protein [Pseudobdellovibrionaceae bacterium]
MTLDRRPPRIADDRPSVADQPFGMIFWTGVVVSVVLGLLLRGILNPQALHQKLESAASQIHPTVRVDFEHAHVSLADGWIPRFAVVIQRVRMISTNTCWMAPRLIADEIRLPISWQALLSGQPPFRRVEAGDVEIRLTALRPLACDEGVAMVMGPQAKPAKKMAIRIVRDEGGKTTASPQGSGEIDSLRIRRLVLVSEVYPQGAVDLSDFNFQVRSTQPAFYQMKSQITIARGGGVGGAAEQALKASLDADYKEFPEKIVDLRINGRLREGTYSLTGSYQPDRDDLKLSADLRHVPLVELFDLIKGRDARMQDFRPRLSWLSLRAETSGEAKRLAQLPIDLTQLRLEGDLGEIVSDRMRLESLSPLKLAPAILQVEMLDWDRFFQYLGKSHPTPILNKIGRFKGVIELADEMNFQMRGEHSGLEFIFSNQSRREIQSVNGIQGQVLRTKGRWSAVVSQASVEQGTFLGQVSLRADSDFQSLDVDLTTKEFSLSPRVQSLMTAGGQISSLQSQLKVHFRSGELETLRGQAKAEGVSIAGARAEKVSFNFAGQSGLTEITPRIEKLSLPVSLLQNVGLQSLFPSTWIRENTLDLSSVGGRFQLRRLNDVKWTGVVGKATTASGSLSTYGSWDPQGTLSGKVSVRNGTASQNFVIEGTRDLPRLRGETK